MKAVPKLVFMCLLAFLLCGLSSRFGIKVVRQEHGQVSFELSKFHVIGGANDVDVNSFLVAEKNETGQWDYKNPMWAFELSPGSSKPLSKITYGQAPMGFTETTKAKPLIRGVHYLAVGLSPGSGGSAEFVAR